MWSDRSVGIITNNCDRSPDFEQFYSDCSPHRHYDFEDVLDDWVSGGEAFYVSPGLFIWRRVVNRNNSKIGSQCREHT